MLSPPRSLIFHYDATPIDRILVIIAISNNNRQASTAILILKLNCLDKETVKDYIMFTI